MSVIRQPHAGPKPPVPRHDPRRLELPHLLPSPNGRDPLADRATRLALLQHILKTLPQPTALP